MRIILLGPPGSGKGTQGELLSQKLNLPRLSVGAILRRALEKKSPEGTEAGKYLKQGLNVPAKLLFKILTPWFVKHKRGWVVDNLPRSIEQLRAFKHFIKENNIKVDRVFHLNVSEKESIKRLLKRAKERKKKGQSRVDDTPEVIRKRRQVGYANDIKLILTYFRKRGILEEIDGEKPIDKVHQEILNRFYRRYHK